MNRYDPATHKYYIGDEQVPSVSAIIPKQQLWVSKERLEVIKNEGLENHSLIKMYYDTGETMGNEMLIALDKFISKNGGCFGNKLLHETPLYSVKHKFAGCPDVVYEMAIIDFKRSFINSEIHALQIAGYYLLAKENGLFKKCDSWMIMWYDGNKFKCKQVYNQQAESIFFTCLKAHGLNKIINNYLGGKNNG
jgi:hypothetical protein